MEDWIWYRKDHEGRAHLVGLSIAVISRQPAIIVLRGTQQFVP
jgi:hypothetical protein